MPEKLTGWRRLLQELLDEIAAEEEEAKEETPRRKVNESQRGV